MSAAPETAPVPRKPASVAILRWVRRAHLYLSCFFAPLLVFYVGTGWYQTLQTDRTKTAGERQDWIGRLTSIHVDQILPNPKAASYDPRLFQWLVVAMSICLLLTIGLGIYLAFRTSKRSWPVVLALFVGLLLPIAFLILGQSKH